MARIIYRNTASFSSTFPYLPTEIEQIMNKKEKRRKEKKRKEETKSNEIVFDFMKDIIVKKNQHVRVKYLLVYNDVSEAEPLLDNNPHVSLFHYDSFIYYLSKERQGGGVRREGRGEWEEWGRGLDPECGQWFFFLFFSHHLCSYLFFSNLFFWWMKICTYTSVCCTLQEPYLQEISGW